eukprot:10360969-Heterocapsa_arctica.AAC.1
MDGTVPPFKAKLPPHAHGVRFTGFTGGGGDAQLVHLYEQPSSNWTEARQRLERSAAQPVVLPWDKDTADAHARDAAAR